MVNAIRFFRNVEKFIVGYLINAFLTHSFVHAENIVRCEYNVRLLKSFLNFRTIFRRDNLYIYIYYEMHVVSRRNYQIAAYINICYDGGGNTSHLCEWGAKF